MVNAEENNKKRRRDSSSDDDDSILRKKQRFNNELKKGGGDYISVIPQSGFPKWIELEKKLAKYFTKHLLRTLSK